MLVVGAMAVRVAVISVRAGWFRSAPDLPAGPRVAATAANAPRAHYYGDLEGAHRHLVVAEEQLQLGVTWSPK